MPSPLMSPAALTEQPEKSRRHPRELEAGGAVERGELEVGREVARRRRVLPEHHVARAGVGTVRVGASAPIIRSAIPSPLMSPASLTEKPEQSPSATPESLKPVVPLRFARLMLAGKPAAAICGRARVPPPAAAAGNALMSVKRLKYFWT